MAHGHELGEKERDKQAVKFSLDSVKELPM